MDLLRIGELIDKLEYDQKRLNDLIKFAEKCPISEFICEVSVIKC